MFKIDFTQIYVPFAGNVDFGLWFIPVFVLIITGTSFAVSQTDGLDGLAGGTLLIAFSYGLIAYTQGRVNLTAMIAVICGSLLAFYGLMFIRPGSLWATQVPWEWEFCLQ